MVTILLMLNLLMVNLPRIDGIANAEATVKVQSTSVNYTVSGRELQPTILVNDLQPTIESEDK